ncbi:uncharacterized protein HD556DRAFT_1441618 [Suillus plorans]|uniref:Uncharacterized protein n=1 Tax=Suillus plorans TaxID=116603 RepID=A0A9P7AWL3_9AGAM|nr:uncharacterized protein HD556DRAFT_1441618 [Suillus plorans]KAG1796314.1 hypothetical protein HD556DRAFT_1441618 [Suillus plorans]
MLKMGDNGVQRDDMLKLGTPVSDWVNLELRLTSPVEPDDKHCLRFVNDACERLLFPSELDWSSPIVKAGIQDRSEGHTVIDLSFSTFLFIEPKLPAKLNLFCVSPFDKPRLEAMCSSFATLQTHMDNGSTSQSLVLPLQVSRTTPGSPAQAGLYSGTPAESCVFVPICRTAGSSVTVRQSSYIIVPSTSADPEDNIWQP